MIPETLPLRQTTSWQDELNHLIRDPEELFALLRLEGQDLEAARKACADFPLRAPRPYVRRIEPGNLQDPLLRQILPQAEELKDVSGYSRDPLQEAESNPTPGLIHKYHGRVLLITSPSCAIHCRYCFRRHFPYQTNTPGRAQWQKALDYIAADNSISEVIYSGGDPLSSSDRQLQWLTEAVAAIPHVQRLRVHTRLPVMIPQRLTEECLNWLTGHRLQTVVVLHINHANELDKEVVGMLRRMRQHGITLFNQTVLLKGVNDSTNALVELSQALFAEGVIPYYLHVLDHVAGAAHFAVGDQEALELRSQLLQQLPGFLVPRLVREVAGASSKVPL